MKVLWTLLGGLSLAGCANRILLDRVEGRSQLPGGRIATLGKDRPGNLSAGGSVEVLKPSSLELRGERVDSALDGIQRWDLPGWTVGAHLAWSPLEGITLSPQAAVGSNRGSADARLAATMGLHADTDVLRWQLEGTLGLAWSRSRLLRRTLVTSPSDTIPDLLDPAVREVRVGWSPQIQAGIQFESAFPRQPFQLWAAGRWGVLDAALLEDAERDAFSVQFVQVAQAGAGFHRALGRRQILTAGILHGMVLAGTEGRVSGTTRFVLQWEAAILQPPVQRATKPQEERSTPRGS